MVLGVGCQRLSLSKDAKKGAGGRDSPIRWGGKLKKKHPLSAGGGESTQGDPSRDFNYIRPLQPTQLETFEFARTDLLPSSGFA